MSNRTSLSRVRDNYAAVTATLALVVALGGTAYAAATITGSDVVDGSLESVDVKNGSLTFADVQQNTLKSANLGSGSVRTDEIADGQVGPTDIANDAVGTNKIANGSVSILDLGSSSVGSDEVLPNSLTANDLAPSSVGASELGANAVAGANVAANSLTGQDIDESTLNVPGPAAFSTFRDSLGPICKGQPPQNPFCAEGLLSLAAGSYAISAKVSVFDDPLANGGLITTCRLSAGDDFDEARAVGSTAATLPMQLVHTFPSAGVARVGCGDIRLSDRNVNGFDLKITAIKLGSLSNVPAAAPGLPFPLP